MKKFFKFCWYKKSELLVLFVANLFVAEYLERNYIYLFNYLFISS